MSNFNDEDDLNIKDKSDMDKLENREFETVPIEDSHSHSIEVFNVYKGIDLSRSKLKRKLNQVLLVVLVIAIIFLMFKILNISPIFNDDSEILNDDNFQDNNFDGPDFDHNEDDDDTIYDEYFYMDQKREKIDLRQLSSPQLKKPENIKLVNKLQISLNLEYDKFVHMKIKDAENSRWEVPEKEVLDKDYLLNKNDNLIEFSKYSKLLDSQYFYIEILSHEVNQTNETLPNDDLDEDNEDKDIDQKDKDEDFDEEEEDIGEGYGKKYNVEDFTFRLMTQENEEFFYFSTKNNFIYSAI